MSSLTSDLDGTPSIVHEVLNSSSEPLADPNRSFFESRFGHDFSRVRLHNDPKAAESARAVNARAYTVGRDIVFGSGALAPEQPDGRELLAHELVHTLQQNSDRPGLTTDLKINHPDDSFEQQARRVAGSIVSPRSHVSVPLGNIAKVSRPTVQRDVPPMDDPTRYKKVHQALFVPPTTTSATGATSNTLPAFDAAAQDAVQKKFTDIIRDLQASNPAAFYPIIDENTTQSDAEKSALAMDKQIRQFYPQIATPLPSATFLTHIHIMTGRITSSDDYLKHWLAESLQKADIEKYGLNEKDPVFQNFLTRLLNDPYLEPRVRELARHKGAFIETSATPHDVYLNRGLTADQREPTLVHELVHFYAHPSFDAWVDSTLDKRIYSEGFTEYLARKAMTADQLKNNEKSYQDRVDRINNEVAKFIPDDDIARAYFAGEVWLLEGKSQVAKKTLKEQTGIDPEAKSADEKKQSHDTEGIVETVAPGERYRFMNLGNEEFNPKQEHITSFTQIYQKFIQNDPTARVRFVGHASSPGTVAFNNDLSLKRAKAFYQMARDAGVPESQLLDAKAPPHFGKSQPTAANDDVLGRTFNRRVELFITHAASPASTGMQTTPSTPAELEKSR